MYSIASNCKILFRDLAAMVHLLKCSIGNGILFLPNGFRRAGYVMAVISSVTIGLLCTHTVVVLVRCSQVLCRRNRIPALDLAQTATVSLQSGPEGIRKYGKIFGVFTNVLICFVQFQAAVVYILYVATSFQQVIEFFSGFAMDVRIYILALFPFACILGFIPNLKYLAPFSMIGSVFMFLGLCVSLYYLLDDVPDPGRLQAFTHPFPVPMYCSLFLFALHNVAVCLPLENTMKNPYHLPLLLTFNTLFNMCLYTVFGFLGYNKYASNTCDTVIKNFPIEEPLAQSVKVVISLSVMFSFGLAYYVPHSIIWPMIKSRYETQKYSEAAFRLVQIVATMTVGIAIPQMVPLVALLNSVSMTTMMLLIPVLIETTTKWETASKLLFAKNIGISVLWILLLISGVIESAWSIVREYNDAREKGC
ncbi:proton-coupled amino acid transporter-like protein pathetic [Andrena cerasifolii]|uniref:proton-coupled amino acid transporter-like protein pathetic n=1 Tax=Andrena cerasifolii TaxID=2819439 RepID=UPI004037BD99